jgi:hypothetical protein
MEISANRLRGKRTSDAYERVGVDNLNGRVYLGNGTAAPTKYVGSIGDQMVFGGGSVSFETDNKHDFGTKSHRPRYVRAASGVQTGAFPRSARPAPGTAGLGTCIFDTTLKRPIWSTGTVWVDATGRTV